MRIVGIKSYDAPPLDRREILRYAGVRGESAELECLLDSCISEISGKISYKLCFSELPLRCEGENTVYLGEIKLVSKGLRRTLDGCVSAVVFAATVGIELDRFIARYGGVSPSKAVIFQAIGAERIEALCDLFCEELKQEKSQMGKNIRARFSPGYSDLSLDTQKQLFELLDCPKNIGLYLRESMLMSPSKSVTAIIGVFDDK